MEPAHLMAALLDQQGGSTDAVAGAGRRQRASPAHARRTTAGNLPKVAGQEGHINVSNGLNRLLSLTDKLAQQRGDAFIASELFVLAALDDKANSGAPCLKAAGATKAGIEAAIEDARRRRCNRKRGRAAPGARSTR